MSAVSTSRPRKTSKRYSSAAGRTTPTIDRRPTSTRALGLSSLSNAGRYRLQLDAAVKRELFKDFFFSISFYNTFDSQPPNPDASKNDVGLVTSIGWSYSY